MITYKIEGCESEFKSKPENFERDVIRWKQRNSLKHTAQVTILSNDDISEPVVDSASDSNPGEQQTLSESTATPKRTSKRKPTAETSDVQPVPDRVDKFDLSDTESITSFNDYPFESE